MRFILLFIGLLLCSCQKKPSYDPQKIIDQTIQQSGLDLLDNKTLSFDFRDYRYTLNRKSYTFSYSRAQKKGDSLIKDILDHKNHFERTINGINEKLPDSLKQDYTESLNSVMYFIQIPKVLNDEAVIKEYVGSTTIKEQPYHAIKITFQQEGGGVDYQDEFRYWIHQEDFTIDYLAYNYQTSGGGTRFRQAINRKSIQGVLFQDYSNFKPQTKFVALDSLPVLFEQGHLIAVSQILNKNIVIRLQKAN